MQSTSGILCAACVLAACTVVTADETGGSVVSVRGSNTLQLARGEGLSEAGGLIGIGPRDYFVNTTVARLEALGFFTDVSFQVEQPSMGFSPSTPVYREYFNRRALGFSNDYLTVQAGHFLTSLGNGLTLNLQEDLDIEKTNILDGVLLELTLPWLSLQGLGGRSEVRKSQRMGDGLDFPEYEYSVGFGDTLLVKPDIDDLNYRDNVLGLYAQGFPFLKADQFSFMSPSSVGAGLVVFRSHVGEEISRSVIDSIRTNPNTGLPDTSFGRKVFQERIDSYVPSAAVNFVTDIVEVSAEHARLFSCNHLYVDSLYDEKVARSSSAYGTYLASNVSAFDFNLLAEYKNYFFARASGGAADPGLAMLGEYSDPPSVQYDHIWQLLNKHVPANMVGDILGYGAVLAWSHFDPTTLTFAYNTGGPHESNDNVVRFDRDQGYWDTYLEWSQDVNDWLDFKLGLDYNKLDAAQQKSRHGTLGAKAHLGPFFDHHGLDLLLELQRNHKSFLAERDSLAVVRLTRTYVDSTTRVMYGGDYWAYSAVPEEHRSEYLQWVTNFVVGLSYSFSPYVVITATLERFEPLTASDYDNFREESEIGTDVTYYRNIALSVRPHQNHTLTLEAGSFSGGMKCQGGSCIKVPAFAGVRFSVNSVF